ncbi:MAG TPA: hypothetical protein GX515_01635 [Firmicutes bacterium]|nr:hypothetical protein [Bacillota bacterium]
MEQDNAYLDEIDLRQYIEILWRGKWLILAVTVCAMISAGLVSLFVLDPVYESSVMFTVSLPQEVQDSLKDPVIAGILGGTPQAQMRLLQDPAVLERAARSLRDGSLSAAALADRVTARVVGDAAKGDRLVEVTVRDSVPENAQALAKAVIESYKDYLSELVASRLTSRRQAISEALAGQKAVASEEVEKVEKLVQESGGSDLITEEINAKTAALANYRWESDQLTSEARAATEALKVLEQQLAAIPHTIQLGWSSSAGGAQQPPASEAYTMTQVNPAYISLLEEVSRKRADLADIQARLEATRQAIPTLEADISRLKAELVRQRAVEEALESALNSAQSRSIELAAELQNFEGQDAGAIVQAAVGVVAPATLPTRPSGPRKLLNVTIAGVLGLMVSVFGVFLVHYWRSAPGPSREPQDC